MVIDFISSMADNRAHLRQVNFKNSKVLLALIIFNNLSSSFQKKKKLNSILNRPIGKHTKHIWA